MRKTQVSALTSMVSGCWPCPASAGATFMGSGGGGREEGLQEGIRSW